MSKNYLFQEIIVKNPVLIGTIGLCPIVAICTSLKAALIMSAITILTLIIAQALSSLVLRHLPQWFRMGLYMLVGMLVVVPFILLVEKLDPTAMLALGIYFPLLAVNPVIVRQCEREGVNIGLSESFFNSLCAGFGYSAVLIIVGIIREILGNGTIWGVPVLPITPAAGMLMPMGGFVVLAFLAALLRAYFKKIDPAYAEELAVNSRTAIKGHKGIKALLIEADDEPQLSADQLSAANDLPSEQTTEEIPSSAEPAPVTESVLKEDEQFSAEAEIAQMIKEVASVSEDKEPPASDAEFAEESAPDMSADNLDVAEKSKRGKKSKKASKKSEKASKKKTPKKTVGAETLESQPQVEAQQKPKYEFITLELPSSKKSEEKTAENQDAPLHKNTAEDTPVEKSVSKDEKKAEQKKTEAKKRAQKAMDDARETASKIAEEQVLAVPVSEEEAKAETSTAKKKHDSKIVYRSEELERLMSMSLDDILNDLPSGNDNSEEGEK